MLGSRTKRQGVKGPRVKMSMGQWQGRQQVEEWRGRGGEAKSRVVRWRGKRVEVERLSGRSQEVLKQKGMSVFGGMWVEGLNRTQTMNRKESG